jgi:hypothetical protein
MAKKGNRVQVILECTEHKNKWSAWHQPLYHGKKQKEQSRKVGVEKI